MKTLTILISFLISTCSLYSQTWERAIGFLPNKEEGAKTICKLANGNFIAGGYAEGPAGYSRGRIAAISENGDTLWSKLVYLQNGYVDDLFSSIALSDNTFLVAGKCNVNSNNSGFVAKFDSDGNNIWAKEYSSYGLNYGILELIKGNDNGFLCTSLDYLMKINDEGTFQWIKPGSFYSTASVYGFKPYDINSYIGAYANFPNPGFGLLKINNAGEVIWQKQITDHLSPEYLYLFSNKMFVFGSTQDTSNSALILNMQTYDSVGNYIHTKRHNVMRQEITGGLYLPINDNRFLISSNNLYLTTDTFHCEIRLLDSNLNLIRKIDLTTKGGFRGLYSAVMQDGKYFLAAGNISIHLGYGYEDFYVIKSDTNLNLQVSIGIKKITDAVPEEFSLKQNYPNPFNGVTQIEFGIKRKGNYSLKIYDVTGKMIEEVFEKDFEPGEYRTVINANKLSSGVYFYRLESGNVVLTKKFILMK